MNKKSSWDTGGNSSISDNTDRGFNQKDFNNFKFKLHWTSN